MSEQERRNLFIAAMRCPEMRLLRSALGWAKWQKHFDWRTIDEIIMAEDISSWGYWWVWLDDWLIVTWDAHKPVLHPDDNFSGYHDLLGVISA